MKRWRAMLVALAALVPGGRVWSESPVARGEGAAPTRTAAGTPTAMRLVMAAVRGAKPGKLPHPCDLLTTKDAERVFGKGARLVRDEVECEIVPEENKLLSLGMIGAKIEVVENWDSTKKMLLEMDKGARQVKGLGDDAFISLEILNIKKGSVQVSVVGTGYIDAKTREAMIRYLGEKLVAGL
jgi:hypothetical protein